MADISLIALQDILEGKLQLQLFLHQKMVWQDISPEPLEPSEIRADVHSTLNNIMKDVDRKLRNQEQLEDHRGTLINLGSKIANKFIPNQLADALRDLVDQNPPTPPYLYIHMHRFLDWIPWEIMFVKRLGFLGEKVQIVRMPILKTELSFNGSGPHQVQRIHNILGKSLLTQDSPEFLAWKSTFSSLPAAAEHERSFPSEAQQWVDFIRPDRIMELPEPDADILHITCHGITENNQYFLWLNKDPQTLDDWKIDVHNIDNIFDFEIKRPLVFGNACASVQALENETEDQLSGLGLTCLDKGATAFIGTFAPISSPLATKFAVEFYHQLLANGLPVGEALFNTKQVFINDPDPSWMFYRLYGSPETIFKIAQ